MMNRLRGENRLVSLVEKAKSECQRIALAVRHDFKTIEDARGLGLTWKDIADGLGFIGKWREVQVAFSREKVRREKKGEKEVMPEKKWIPGPKEEKKKSPGLERPVQAGGARLIPEQKPEDLFNSMPKM